MQREMYHNGRNLTNLPDFYIVCEKSGPSIQFVRLHIIPFDSENAIFLHSFPRLRETVSFTFSGYACFIFKRQQYLFVFFQEGKLKKENRNSHN